MGGDAEKINPLAPAEMVIDHSVIADEFGTTDAFFRNVELEYGRNRERYQFRAGARPRSTTSRSSRPAPASSIR